jgi:hypothetical protein
MHKGIPWNTTSLKLNRMLEAGAGGSDTPAVEIRVAPLIDLRVRDRRGRSSP